MIIKNEIYKHFPNVVILSTSIFNHQTVRNEDRKTPVSFNMGDTLKVSVCKLWLLIHPPKGSTLSILTNYFFSNCKSLFIEGNHLLLLKL